MKKFLLFLLLMILCVGIVIAGGFKDLKIVSSSGSGGIDNVWGGIIYVTIDTTADTSGAAFVSETYNTETTNGGLQGYVYIGYNQDSTAFVDTFIITLKTAMKDNNSALAWTIRTDTVNTSDYLYYSYTGNDTLFKSDTWFELNIFDSTSDSAGTAVGDGNRYYKFSSGLNAKE